MEPSETPGGGTVERGGPVEEEFELDADLILSVIHAEGEEGVVSAQLSQVKAVHMRDGGPVPGEDLLGIREGLQTAWIARMTAAGVVRSLEFPPGTDPSRRNRLRAVLSAIQIVLPEPEARSWTATENELFGRFEASYVSGDPGRDGVLEIVRRRRCVEAHGSVGAPANLVPEISTDGETRVTFDTRHGLIRELRSRETIVISGSAMPIRVTCASERHLTLVSATATVALAARVETEDWIHADGLAGEPVAPPSASRERRADGPRDGCRSFDAAFQDALRLSDGADWEQAAIPMWMEFSEIFRTDPASVALAEARLSAATPQEERASGLLIDALGNAGSAAAQAALLRTLRRRGLPSDLRARALYAAVNVESPTEEHVQEILRLADDAECSAIPGECILTGLGIAASKGLGRGDRAAADAVVARIERALEGSTDPSQRLGAILGLGNAGHPASLKTLLRETGSADEASREAAAFALRKMPRPAALPRLEQLLTEDPAEAVRVAALNALASSPGPQEDRAIARALDPGAPESLRREALAYLSDVVVYQGGSTEMRRFRLERVLQAADSDPSEDVRNAARESLAALSAIR